MMGNGVVEAKFELWSVPPKSVEFVHSFGSVEAILVNKLIRSFREKILLAAIGVMTLVEVEFRAASRNPLG
jgi:hypothetical protein